MTTQVIVVFACHMSAPVRVSLRNDSENDVLHVCNLYAGAQLEFVICLSCLVFDSCCCQIRRE